MARVAAMNFLTRITRKTRIPEAGPRSESELHQSLGTFHLTVMGLGTMIGAGLYVLTGVVAQKTAGPAVTVSYALSGLAALLSALCYAEFAGKIPRTGSAYTFAYVSLGEVWAFLIGWNLLLEYFTGAASVASTFSAYIDDISNNAISNFTINHVLGGSTWKVSFLGEYPDFVSMLFIIVLGIFVVIGVSVSVWVNTAILAVNMLAILIIIVAGLCYLDISNWTDYGGFAPYGVEGVIAGAGTVFYAYSGFDTIAICNEESTNPRKGIPIATVASIVTVIVCYIMAAAVLTLMVPYTEINLKAVFTSAFAYHGVTWAKWVVSAGMLCALTTGTFGSLFSMMRCLYAMAKDGLLPPFFGVVNRHTQVPVNSGIVAVLFCCLLAMFFSQIELVLFLSIGTLSSFAFVAGALIIVRYQPPTVDASPDSAELLPYPPSHGPDAKPQSDDANMSTNVDNLLPEQNSKAGELKERFLSMPVVRHLARVPPGRSVIISVILTVVFQFCALTIVQYYSRDILAGSFWPIIFLVVFGSGAVLSFLVITLHEQQNTPEDYFSVKCVPLIPTLSMLINIMLMLRLGLATWVRYIVWLVAGLVFYLAYGYRKSHLVTERNSLVHEPRDSSKQYGGT